MTFDEFTLNVTKNLEQKMSSHIGDKPKTNEEVYSTLLAVTLATVFDILKEYHFTFVEPKVKN